MTSAQEKGLNLLYKNLGETPNEAILRFKKDNPQYADVPMTYAGRLDPMAEGLLLVLSGEGIKERQKYLDLPKTYEFEVLWGFETDTLDVLGKVVESKKLEVERSDLEVELKKMIGRFEQKYPAYSSKPVSGKPLFQWAREGKIAEVEIPSHEVEIFDISYISSREISKNELLRYIVVKVNSVSGDFRQKEIIDLWSNTLSKMSFDTFQIDKISLTVSSGFYVRQFVSDLGKKFGAKVIAFHIKRTKIGDFTINADI